MFSRPERLQQRTPENGVGRFDYLQQLVNEFKSTKSSGKFVHQFDAVLQTAANHRLYNWFRSLSYFWSTSEIRTRTFCTPSLWQLNVGLICYLAAKEQVLANLANFAYDPINYGFLKSLHVIDLFLDQLSETNPKLVQYAVGGLCNLVAGNAGLL